MTTLLLVEDTLDLARTLLRELEAEGYQVLHAADGLQAVEMYARQQPDLVILDWMLPRLDGLEVLRRIRSGAAGTQSAVPVLMLTARSEEIDRVIGLEVGADDYLTKPFSTRELVARVRALLRRIDHVRQIVESDRQGAAASPGSVSYGPLVLDPLAYQALLAGTHLDLTRTEFDLLALFIRHPGRAFSRTYLLETVWGENYIAGDRSVDNAILRLRKKMGSLGENLETVWGVGYRLKPSP